MKTTRILFPLIAGLLTVAVAGTLSSCKNSASEPSKSRKIDIPSQVLGAEATITFNDRKDKHRINFIDQKYVTVVIYNVGTFEATYEFQPRFDNTSGTIIVRGVVQKEIEVELGDELEGDPENPVQDPGLGLGGELADNGGDDPAEEPGEEPAAEEEIKTEIVVKELPFEYTIEVLGSEKLEGWVSSGHLTTNEGDAEFRDVVWK